MWGIILRILGSAGSAMLPYILPYLKVLRQYLWVVTLVVGAAAGWYLTSNWYKLDTQARMGAALAVRNTQIEVLLRRNETLAKENAAIQTRSDNAKKQYGYLLNRNPLCNARLGVVRMLNVQLDPMYRPKDLHPNDASAASTVTGGDIAEALGQCAIQYNKTRNEIIRLRKEADKQQ